MTNTPPPAYFEDYAIGDRADIGSYVFTEHDIVQFAEKYDPQRFHMDADAAAQTQFGGLVASGWHVGAISMKLMVAHYKRKLDEAPVDPNRPPPGISPGILDMRWIKPVRPGDALNYSVEVVEKVELNTRPEFGIIRSKNEAHNQDGELVFSFIGQVMAPRRNNGTSGESAI